ncbi:hypothetical protein MANY_27220 [Mycolicibacterium anyangense]|uniref:Uncharacterized protein n=1 Tax=Mycolicibacterium anyangense TaxID=1431246 RepID=A0A6N4W9E9_9MYCO|nr:hypothetical protein [Mycolicibacterium anyangense]BBZ77385.1 hypothetical protein MANY_27220 [Mycolicibacterium anyangense]
MIDLLTTAVSVLADPPKNSGPDFGKASPIGLLVVVLLLIGVFILVWSMNRHLKKLPESFDGEPAEPTDAPAEESAAAETGKSASESSG